MRIVSLEALPVRLPFHHPYSDSLGTYAGSNHGIVIVRDESGEYGAGEIALAWFGGAHLLCREVNEVWAPHLIGEEATDINRISAKLAELTAFSKRHLLAKAGIETALFDLIGKHAKLPLYRLLGGKCRDSIPLTGGIGIDAPEIMAESAKLKVEEGYKELKIKVGLDDRKDLAAIASIRKAIPDDVALRVDANMAWKNARHAKKMMDELYRYGVHIVEQPLGSDRLDELAWLREHTEALLLIDEGAWDIRDAKQCLDRGAGDLLHIYVCEAGGPDAARKMFELAALYGVDCTLGSMPEARIGSAASAHIGLAMSNLSVHASDVRGFTLYSDDVVCEDLIIEDGRLTLSERPGLGVTIDFDKLNYLKASE